MMQTMEQTIQMAKDTSRYIIDSGEEHMPILIMFTSTEVVNAGISGMEKEDFKVVVSQLLRHFHAHAYIFINECWMTKLNMDSPLFQELESGRKQISDLPPDDREEVIVITATENGKSCRMWTANIQYTRDDKRYLGEWKEMDSVGDGRMTLKEW